MNFTGGSKVKLDNTKNKQINYKTCLQMLPEFSGNLQRRINTLNKILSAWEVSRTSSVKYFKRRDGPEEKQQLNK